MVTQPSKLGFNIHILRRQTGLTQYELGARVGIAGNTLSRLERGDLRDLSGATVSRIADVLGVSMDLLYGRRMPTDGHAGKID